MYKNVTIPIILYLENQEKNLSAHFFVHSRKVLADSNNLTLEIQFKGSNNKTIKAHSFR